MKHLIIEGKKGEKLGHSVLFDLRLTRGNRKIIFFIPFYSGSLAHSFSVLLHFLFLSQFIYWFNERFIHNVIKLENKQKGKKPYNLITMVVFASLSTLTVYNILFVP